MDALTDQLDRFVEDYKKELLRWYVFHFFTIFEKATFHSFQWSKRCFCRMTWPKRYGNGISMKNDVQLSKLSFNLDADCLERNLIYRQAY